MKSSIFQRLNTVSSDSINTEFSEEFIKKALNHKKLVPDIPNTFLEECVNKNYIVLIYDKFHNHSGCGFFVGDLLFTCGHVVSNTTPEPYIVVNSQFVPLFIKNKSHLLLTKTIQAAMI